MTSQLTNEWYVLREKIKEKDYSSKNLTNDFFIKLIRVFSDADASDTDKLLAYRDALCAVSELKTIENITLPCVSEINYEDNILKKCKLKKSYDNNISLNKEGEKHDFKDIYQLKKCRYIFKTETDPIIKKQLGEHHFSHYNGNAQQWSVRTALLTDLKKTIIINLPTGCGKTLVAHALTINSTTNKLTLVIIPTISLAIEQASRVKELLSAVKKDHGGDYYWVGDLSKEKRNDIQKRIEQSEQKILFCGPETLCQSSLQSTLFKAAKAGQIENIVIDEAHIIDQWGVDFRPYYQMSVPVIKSLRQKSINGIKCILMSATISEKTTNTLEYLFKDDDYPLIKINGCFLRPEIKYIVKKVNELEHEKETINAIFDLPKPLIVYSTTKEGANSFYERIKENGIKRVEKFTGDTSTDKRKQLIEKWNDRKLDIMVATSAFGLGMDRGDIRSILHIAVPENLDRFYQDVGRAGRDGRACQSFLIYHQGQFAKAEKINNQKLISCELGFKKFEKMWNIGTPNDDGSRKIDMGVFHDGLNKPTDENQSWNYQTLLLMQRAGAINIINKETPLPNFDDEMDEEKKDRMIKKHYEDYYNTTNIELNNNDILDEKHFTSWVGPQRSKEKEQQTKGYTMLKNWIDHHDKEKLCQTLKKFYTIDNHEPELTCGGCPKCSQDGSILLPKVGGFVRITGMDDQQKWTDVFSHYKNPQKIYYSSQGDSLRRDIKYLLDTIQIGIEKGVIQSIYANHEVLNIITEGMDVGMRKFWAGSPLEAGPKNEHDDWKKLVIITDKQDLQEIQEIQENAFRGLTLLLGRKDIDHPDHPGNKWYERDADSVTFDFFKSGLRDVNN
tara:strand:+ start:902 stop:3430 length:2529 start_codon:yes stop_codon:yes gene_type:complete